jgi:hypothetical protein
MSSAPKPNGKIRLAGPWQRVAPTRCGHYSPGADKKVSRLSPKAKGWHNTSTGTSPTDTTTWDRKGLGIRLEKICYIIDLAREFDVKVDPVAPEQGSNESDDGDRRILEDLDDDATFRSLIDALGGRVYLFGRALAQKELSDALTVVRGIKKVTGVTSHVFVRA